MSNQTNNNTIDTTEEIDNLCLVISDLILDSFIAKKQQTKGTKTRHTKSELKHTFQDSNSRLSKS
jgi:hypothetical protein